jgi:OOP family OmpA-OmpF porin
MKTLLKSLIVPAALLLVTACASGDGAPASTPKAQSKYPALNAELAPRYSALANFEQETGDSAAVAHYNGKAADATGGFEVLPDAVSSRNIAADKVGDLSAAHDGLMGKYAEGYAESQPADLADAQTQYDCWLEEQEEGWQLLHIARCRANFEAAMAKMVPAAKPKPKAAKSANDYVIYFRFDQTDLTNLASSRLQSAISDAMSRKNPKVVVGAHTDTSGSAKYNARLSNRRAKVVRDALIAAGVDGSAITAVGFGEASPAVITADQTKNAKNRRAEIRVSGE